jgi:hypothetical protein
MNASNSSDSKESKEPHKKSINNNTNKETKEDQSQNPNNPNQSKPIQPKPAKRSIKRLAVLNSIPIVELSSRTGNLFDNVQADEAYEEFFTYNEQQTILNAQHSILMIDVEACDAMNGPVLAIGCVFGVYKDYMKYDILRRNQWIISRTINDCAFESKKFWQGSASEAWNYFTTSPFQYNEFDAAVSFRKYMDSMWKHVPTLCVMVDCVHVDLTLVNNLLVKYKCKPLHYDHLGKYQHSIYVCRDLMRGAYASIDANFAYLPQSGLSKAVNECWKKLVGYGKPFIPSSKMHDILIHGKMEKHFPIWDATQSMILWFQTEDIRIHYEMRFPRVSAALHAHHQPHQQHQQHPVYVAVPFHHHYHHQQQQQHNPNSLMTYPVVSTFPIIGVGVAPMMTNANTNGNNGAQNSNQTIKPIPVSSSSSLPMGLPTGLPTGFSSSSSSSSSSASFIAPVSVCSSPRSCHCLLPHSFPPLPPQNNTSS